MSKMGAMHTVISTRRPHLKPMTHHIHSIWNPFFFSMRHVEWLSAHRPMCTTTISWHGWWWWWYYPSSSKCNAINNNWGTLFWLWSVKYIWSSLPVCMSKCIMNTEWLSTHSSRQKSGSVSFLQNIIRMTNYLKLPTRGTGLPGFFQNSTPAMRSRAGHL